MFFLSVSWQIPAKHPKLGHDHFIQDFSVSLFIVIQSFAAVQYLTESPV
jgi:hypothetical protein